MSVWFLSHKFRWARAPEIQPQYLRFWWLHKNNVALQKLFTMLCLSLQMPACKASRWTSWTLIIIIPVDLVYCTLLSWMLKLLSLSVCLSLCARHCNFNRERERKQKVYLSRTTQVAPSFLDSIAVTSLPAAWTTFTLTFTCKKNTTHLQQRQQKQSLSFASPHNHHQRCCCCIQIGIYSFQWWTHLLWSAQHVDLLQH